MLLLLGNDGATCILLQVIQGLEAMKGYGADVQALRKLRELHELCNIHFNSLHLVWNVIYETFARTP